MSTDLSARDIAQRLAARIVELCAFLLPAGFREGAEWRCGSVAGECGDSKRQITYLGDVLNVTARLEQAGKAMNADVVISADLLSQVTLPPDVQAIDRGEHLLKGMLQPIQIFALARGEASFSREFTPRYANDLAQ